MLGFYECRLAGVYIHIDIHAYIIGIALGPCDAGMPVYIYIYIAEF